MAPVKPFGVVFSKQGFYRDVLKVEEIPLREVEKRSVLVKVLGSPVNPSDIGYVTGTYGVKPNFQEGGTVTPGFEGAMEVLEVGPEAKTLSRGDWVISSGNPEFRVGGHWRSHNVVDERALSKIDIRDRDFACTLIVNPRTAYHLLHDYVELSPGDVVVQNGANSACGQLVIQLAKIMGVRTVSIVRDRPDFNELKARLLALGATLVVRAEEFSNFDFKVALDAAPKLALDCVGGEATAALAKKLARNGVLVNYGSMSRKPLMVPAGRLIFNGISVRGFWLSDPSKTRGNEALNAIVKYHKEGKLRAPHCTYITISNTPEAAEKVKKTLDEIQSSVSTTKYLFEFMD